MDDWTSTPNQSLPAREVSNLIGIPEMLTLNDLEPRNDRYFALFNHQ